MKQKHPRRLALVISTICIGTPLHAADITWDTAATAGIQGGAGTWGAFTTNWTSDGGDTRVGWDNATFAADTALFTTGTGRVTVDGTINLKGITNTSTDSSTIGGRPISYLLEGSGSLNFGSQQGVINTLAAGLTNLQINNNLIGSVGLSIEGANAPATGNGWITLAGTNTGLTGGITVENGLLGVNGLGSLGTNAVTLNGNAGLFGPIDIAGPATTATAGPGTLTLAVPVSVNGTGNILRVWGGRTLTLSAALTGSGDASKTDTGALVLSNATGYSGVLTQVAGSTTVGSDFGGSISAATGNVTLGGSLAGNLSLTGAANVNVAGNVSGNLNLAGGGAVNLGGNLAGTLTFTQGRLSLGGTYTGDVAVTGLNSSLILGTAGVITGNITTQFNSGHSLVIEGQVNGNVDVEELVATRLNGAEITANLTLGFDNASTQTNATISGDTVAIGGDLKVNGSVTLQIDGTIPSGTPILTFSSLITDTVNPADHITVLAPPSFTDVVVTYNSGSIVVTYTPGPLALTWDISSAPDIQIGAGTWNTSSNNWTYDGGSTNSFWTNGSGAAFAGDLPAVAGGTAVTLNGALSVNGITRTGANGVRLVASAGNTLALSGTLDAASGSALTLAANGDNQFTGSFTKTGAGFLEINGSDSQLAFTSVTLNEGVIGFFGASGLQSEAVALNGGAIGSITTVARSLDGAVTIGGNIGIGSGTGLSTGAINFGSAGTVDLGGATRTLTIGSEVNFNGVVSNGGITKEGAGRLTLANIANTITGATVVNAGELRTLSANAETGLLSNLGSGSVTVNTGAILRFGTGSTTNAKSYANDININNATLAASDGTHTLTGNLALTGANTIEVQWGGKNLILTGAVSGSSSITKTGAGDLIFGNGGTSGNLPAGIDVAINAGIVAFNRSDAITLNNNLSGVGSLRNLGGGTTALTGNNTYGGSTSLQGGGTLVVTTIADAGGAGSIGTLSTPGTSWLGVRENSTLRITGTGTQTTSRFVWNDAGVGSGTFDVVDAGASIVFTTTGGTITRELIKTGAGAMTLTRQITTTGAVTVNGGSLTLLGLNTYTGETQVNAGTLSLAQASLDDLSTVRINTGATLDLPHGIEDTVARLFVNGVQQPANTYNSGNSAFITGTGSLVVTEDPPAGYPSWIDTFFTGVTDPLIVGPNADPDGDGVANVVEFLTGGIPNDNSQNGLLWVGTSGDQLVMSLAIRGESTAFGGSPSPGTSVDGITAAVQGSLNLDGFTAPVSSITFVLPPGWSPTPPAGYSYHSFKLDASTGLPDKGFLRLRATQP